jgi:hypothetical protein
MNLFSRFRPSDPLALVLAFFAAESSIVLNRVVFEALPHTEDEVAFLFQAMTYARGHLLAPAPPLPAAFFIPFVIVRDGMWFGKYPPGYPLVLSLGVLVGYPPLVNALAAAACILLIVAIGRRWYDATTAWLAGLLLLVSPFFLLQAASLMAHTVCLALTLLFTWSFLATVDRPRARAAMPGMVALALLVLARPLTALGVLLPFVLWSTWRFWRVPAWRHQHSSSRRAASWPRQRSWPTTSGRPATRSSSVTSFGGPSIKSASDQASRPMVITRSAKAGSILAGTSVPWNDSSTAGRDDSISFPQSWPPQRQ